MDRTEKLNEIATVAGLRDVDLLKVVKADLSPIEAVRDLLRRYPGAFDNESSRVFDQAAQPKDYKQMSPEERDAFCRRHGLPGQLKHPNQPIGFDAMTPQEQAAFRRKHNISGPTLGSGRGMWMY